MRKQQLLVSALCGIIILSSLMVPSLPQAAAYSKSWTKDFVESSGKSNYTLTLNSPDVVQSSSNWTLTTTLNIDYMDRYKTFLFYSTIGITVETPDGHQVKKSVAFGHYPIGQFPDRIYPGGRWGPTNITIDLSQEGKDLNPSPGGTNEMKIYVTVSLAEFLFQPFRAEQLPQTTFQTFSMDAGTVRIVSQGGGAESNLLPYMLGVAVAVVVFAGLIVSPRFTNKKPSNQTSNRHTPH
ncbi:MAG: hypothetical protein M1503_02600 [Thaumarchaeota archaeon]|nr:hypothetical protein [Nitrososphaerota archaeon]MCL5317141.1 hypothetical protein [Nitrososphaerota archaeon]